MQLVILFRLAVHDFDLGLQILADAVGFCLLALQIRKLLLYLHLFLLDLVFSLLDL